MDRVEGGYITVRAGELLSLLIAYREGMKPAAVRLYLASHLEAAEQRFTSNRQVILADLAKKANLADYTAQKALRELEAEGLLTLKGGTPKFHLEVTPQAAPYLADLKTNPNRPVPIPRRIMKVLARHGKASELIGTLIHLLRCLFIKQNRINNTGFITNGLITRLTGLSDRAIQGARKWMESMGLIFARKVNQRIVNRFGRCFSVNLKPPSETRPEEIIYQENPSKVAELAPPPCVTPIYVNNKLNNQYVPLKEKSSIQHSGVFEKTIGRPTLTDIKPEDLKLMPRLEVLYRQAVARKWLPDCEASIKNFVGAATRAVQVEGNPVKIFVGIVKKGLWRNITQAQEDISLRNLNHYRANNPVAFTKSSSQGTPAFIPEVVTPRTRPEETRPERVVIRKGQPQSPQLTPLQFTPISEIVSNLLSRLSLQISS